MPFETFIIVAKIFIFDRTKTWRKFCVCLLLFRTGASWRGGSQRQDERGGDRGAQEGGTRRHQGTPGVGADDRHKTRGLVRRGSGEAEDDVPGEGAGSPGEIPGDGPGERAASPGDNQRRGPLEEPLPGGGRHGDVLPAIRPRTWHLRITVTDKPLSFYRSSRLTQSNWNIQKSSIKKTLRIQH